HDSLGDPLHGRAPDHPLAGRGPPTDSSSVAGRRWVVLANTCGTGGSSAAPRAPPGPPQEPSMEPNRAPAWTPPRPRPTPPPAPRCAASPEALAASHRSPPSCPGISTWGLRALTADAPPTPGAP